MSAFGLILNAARARPRRIVLPEATDERILRAGIAAADQDLAVPVLLGDPSVIRQLAARLQLDLGKVELADPASHARREHYVQMLVQKRAHRGMTTDKATTALDDPVCFACLMVSEGDADGCVAGAITPTAHVVTCAMRYVGKKPEAALVSSCFVMLMQPHHPTDDIIVIGDCALVIDPTAEELASIAVSTGDTAIQLLNLDPRMAMLSFSTMGSARHAAVTKVSNATELAQKARPDWHILGEVQLDAAVIPDILARKAPELASEKPCNVLIFPTLDAGNIGYKLMQRIGGAQAIGPILQGLQQPVNDLSRGCSTDDVISMIAVTAAQVER